MADMSVPDVRENADKFNADSGALWDAAQNARQLSIDEMRRYAVWVVHGQGAVVRPADQNAPAGAGRVVEFTEGEPAVWSRWDGGSNRTGYARVVVNTGGADYYAQAGPTTKLPDGTKARMCSFQSGSRQFIGLKCIRDPSPSEEAAIDAMLTNDEEDHQT